MVGTGCVCRYMKKFIPLVDWIIFGGLTLFGIIGLILILCTPQEWDIIKIIAVFVPLSVFIVTPVIILIVKYTSRPDYITAQGTYVWTIDMAAEELMLGESVD